jgi:PhnB protein
MTTINTYLIFNGNCEEAFNFYKSIFGGEFSYFGRFGDMPPSEEMTVPDNEKNLVMHVSLPISKETALMGSDATAGSGAVRFGNNFSVSIDTASKEEADRFFNGLSKGGIVIMQMQNTFWGAYFGMFTDKFGVNWMVNFDMSEPA